MAIEDMANKGAAKLRNKADAMASNWNNAKASMVDNYRAVGFGPTVTGNYETAIRNATYYPPDVDKWRQNWLDKMSR